MVPMEVLSPFLTFSLVVGISLGSNQAHHGIVLADLHGEHPLVIEILIRVGLVSITPMIRVGSGLLILT
tara:strand:+ start:271 stop:477 length:207 start_codon:yes stop_codon:yes gene_type:complete